MNANDVIECYVADVAVLLPRTQRNDVAFELRALLREELQAKAEATGQGLDAALAVEFLRTFGAPADVAARYRPTLTVIDPADGQRFVRASVIGLVILWTLGLMARLQQPIESVTDLLNVLGQWWTGTVIASMWWPGVLVVGFGTASWVRRRWPRKVSWNPRAADRISGGRASLAMGIVGIVCGLLILIDPRWLLDLFWGGHAAPSAYAALSYSMDFLQRQGLLLLVLILLNIPLFAAVIIKGRWSPILQRLDVVLRLSTCVTMGWAVMDGPILMAPGSDQMTKFLMALIIVFVLGDLALKASRTLRPGPDYPVRA